MKKIIILLLIIFSISGAYAKESMLNNDKILIEIKENIPDNWKIIIDNNMLIFERDGNVWLLFENQINAPFTTETEEDKIDRIKKHGIKTKSKVIYIIEKKWDKNKYKKAEQHNKKISQQIYKLLDKYNIRHLYNDQNTYKGDHYFKEGTPEEEARINKYLKEEQKLLSQLIHYPSLHTSKSSLFFSKMEGVNDSYSLVHPEEASIEAYKIMNLLKELCENPE